MAEYITGQPNAEARSTHIPNKSTWFQLYPERLLLQLARVPDPSLRGDLLLIAVTVLLEGGLPNDADEVAFAAGLSVERVHQLWPLLMRFQDKSEEWDGLIMPSFISAIIYEQREYREKFAAAGRAAQEKRKAKSGGDGDDSTPKKSTRKPASTDAEASLNGAKEDSASLSDVEHRSTSLNDAQRRSTNTVHDNTKHDRTDKKEKSAERASGAAAPTLSLVPSAPSLSNQVSEIFEHWKARLKHPNAKLTSERRRLVEARLKKDGYTVDQIKQAIDGCSRSVFHQGGNQHGTIYDDLSLICRDGTHLERFIAITEGPVRTGEAWVGSASKPTPIPPIQLASELSEEAPQKAPTGTFARVLAHLKTSIGEGPVRIWFEPLGANEDGNTLYLRARDPVFQSWITNNYAAELAAAIEAEGLSDVVFVFGNDAGQQQIEEAA